MTANLKGSYQTAIGFHSLKSNKANVTVVGY